MKEIQHNNIIYTLIPGRQCEECMFNDFKHCSYIEQDLKCNDGHVVIAMRLNIPKPARWKTTAYKICRLIMEKGKCSDREITEFLGYKKESHTLGLIDVNNTKKFGYIESDEKSPSERKWNITFAGKAYAAKEPHEYK